MKRTVLALLACGLLAACEDLPTDVTTGMNGNELKTNTATTSPSGNAGVTPARGTQPTAAPSQYVPRTTPTQQATPTPPQTGYKSEATINGNQVTVSFPDEEPVSYVNGLPVKK